ncbi:uncharacterized protein METZ01_LOCUS234931, partial [marine metagenome]
AQRQQGQQQGKEALHSGIANRIARFAKQKVE